MKILLVDIESAPLKVMAWGLFDQNIGTDFIEEDGYILCYAAKWLGSNKTYFDSIHKSGETKMLESIHALLDEADAIITYNGKRYDVPVLNREFLLKKMMPPSPYKHIDLFQTAKRRFRFPSNKLDYIAKALGFTGKTKHRGVEMWKGCMRGDAKSWASMEKYNRKDVTELEKVYLRVLPWVENHPNYGLFNTGSRPVCCQCGKSHLQSRGPTPGGTHQRYQCVDCGRWQQGPILKGRVIPATKGINN